MKELVVRHARRGKTWFTQLTQLGKVVVLVLGAVMVVQLLYPWNRALPFAQLNNEPIGQLREHDIIQKITAEYTHGTLKTYVWNREAAVSYREAGVGVAAEKTARQAVSYPWYVRLVPFSMFTRGYFTNQRVLPTVDEKTFFIYASERARECEVVPKNAGVIVEEGEIVLSPAEDGAECKKETLQRQVEALSLQKGETKLAIRTQPVKPSRSNSDVKGLLAEANRVASREITIEVLGELYDVDKSTLAGWLAFPEDSKTHKLSVGVNEEAIKEYLEVIQKDIYIEPGTTHITTRDGIELSRVDGASGRGIDMDRTAATVGKQVLEGSGVVMAGVSAVPPKLVYSRSYSSTPAGLQALVDDLVKGKDIAISVRKLGDTGVSANGNKQYHPASTYKLFVAYSVLKRIDSGQFTWGQMTDTGKSIAQCFDTMIVHSDNPCSEWFGSTIGWTQVTNEARALGAHNTTLSRPFVSTADDLALFLQKLESNQLGISELSRARLLDAMKRQVFRQGIPTGVGVSVADKVGFLEGKLHDAAIVYAPSGVYVLVIMTDSSSWGAIADAAKQVHEQMVQLVELKEEEPPKETLPVEPPVI